MNNLIHCKVIEVIILIVTSSEFLVNHNLVTVILGETQGKALRGQTFEDNSICFWGRPLTRLALLTGLSFNLVSSTFLFFKSSYMWYSPLFHCILFIESRRFASFNDGQFVILAKMSSRSCRRHLFMFNFTLQMHANSYPQFKMHRSILHF